MQIYTTRFGSIPLEPNDVLDFPSGIAGFENLTRWVLLGDSVNETVAWLQSVTQPDVAVAVVSPRRFVHDYQVHVVRSELESLELSSVEQAYVLVIVSKDVHHLTVNLKAPLIVNLDRRLGKQVTTADERPVQHYVADLPVRLRKSA